ncbi:cation:proton antiporter [Elongatibacter sediminis]|uniref:Cation:proton antiporter n=1 Tax=Elongatibacter sediminis TaxID=3119006 RepID=A0AAW9RGF2_9GAMM
MTQWLDIILVFLLGGLISWLSMRYRFPNAVAQVVLGVILGTAVLGWVPHSVLLHDLGEIGVVLLLGVVAMGLGLPRLKAGGWAGAQVALLGIAFSIGGGYAIGQAFDFPIEETIYLSLALGATSIGITVQVLEQFSLITHRIAEIVIAAAVLDDLIVLYFLGLAHGLLGGGYGPAESMKFFLGAFLAIGGLYWVGRTATVWAFRFRLISHPFAQGLWAVAMIALGAVVTRSLGMSLVVGAFFAGLSIAGGLPESQAKKGALALRPLVLGFMPFFFVMIGVQFDWTALSAANALWLLLSVIAVGILAKTLGGIIGAASVANWRDRWLVGFGMVARGEVALVIATLGLKQGHLTQPVYAAILVMAVTAAVIGPLLMTPLAKRATPGN